MVRRRAFPVQKAGDPRYAENMNSENGCFCMGRTSVTSQNKKFKLYLKRRFEFFSVSTNSVL